MSDLVTSLFPLTTHVLPGGKLPLRIFEPRYIRMVKEAVSNGRTFCMCMMDPDAKPGTLVNMFPLITRVQIVDFDALPDGFLGITVAGVELRRLQRVWVEPDGLKVGESVSLIPWSRLDLSDADEAIAWQLKRLYQEHKQLRQLQLTFDEHNASWLCQRWLELLPLHPDDKQLLIEQPDCKAALAFLQQTIRPLGVTQ